MKRDRDFWKDMLKALAVFAAGILLCSIASFFDDVSGMLYFAGIIAIITGVVLAVHGEKSFRENKIAARKQAETEFVRLAEEKARNLQQEAERQRVIRERHERELHEAERQEKIKAVLERQKEQREKAIRDFTEDLDMIAESRVDIVCSDEPAARHLVSEMAVPHFMNITRSINTKSLFPLVVLDVETTGLNVSYDSIVEVSAIKFERDFKTPTSCFTSFTKPKKSIPAEATAINGINNQMLENAPPFEMIADSFTEYISGCNIIGHNLLFDLKFLFCGGACFSEKVRYYDTLDLAKRTLTKYEDVPDYKLDTLAEYFGIYRDSTHRSLSDCFATSFVFKGLLYLRTDKSYVVEKEIGVDAV